MRAAFLAQDSGSCCETCEQEHVSNTAGRQEAAFRGMESFAVVLTSRNGRQRVST